MRKFVIATKNIGKFKEINEILSGLDYDVMTMDKAGIHEDIEEYGDTFEENALIKATEVSNRIGEIVMADDSGLEVDFLDGAPGIYTARFAGAGASDVEKNNKLLELLKDVPIEKRGAKFVCAIAVLFPNGKKFTVRGTCEGVIALKPKGNRGFGYDPIFYVPDYKMTTAEMTSELKHSISHRGKALRLMLEKLKSMELGF